MGVKVYGIKGEEGDDVTATVAVKMACQGARVIVDSKDKDFAVLVKDGSIELLQPKAKEPLDEEGVFETYGVRPKHMTEYLMLLGDGVDNIPGVNKCGPKTAAKWLNEYGSIKRLLRHTDDLTPVLRRNLLEAKDNFELTRKLIELRIIPGLKPTYEKLEMGSHDIKEIERICRKLAFNATLDQIKAFLGRQENLWG
jgi:DNA polymerase-1